MSVLLGISLVMLGFGCAAGGPSQASVEVTYDEFMQNKHISEQVEVAVDGTLTVTLVSNPTTGFQWSEQAQIGDQTILQQTGHQFMAPEAKGGTPPLLGSAGKEVWTFKTLKKGTTTVSMDYSRPWEGGEKGEWTFSLTVVAK